MQNVIVLVNLKGCGSLTYESCVIAYDLRYSWGRQAFRWAALAASRGVIKSSLLGSPQSPSLSQSIKRDRSRHVKTPRCSKDSPWGETDFSVNSEMPIYHSSWQQIIVWLWLHTFLGSIGLCLLTGVVFVNFLGCSRCHVQMVS